MDKVFNLGKDTFEFNGDEIIIVSDNVNEAIKYVDILDMNVVEGSGGFLKDKIEGILTIKTKNANFEITFKNTSNEEANAIVKAYNRRAFNESGERRLGSFPLVHQIGLIRSRKSNQCEMYIYNDRVGFGYSNEDAEAISYNDILKIELVEHIQFMSNVSVASTLVIGALAAATPTEELFIIDMLVIDARVNGEKRKVILTLSEDTKYDLEYVYSKLNESYEDYKNN